MPRCAQKKVDEQKVGERDHDCTKRRLSDPLPAAVADRRPAALICILSAGKQVPIAIDHSDAIGGTTVGKTIVLLLGDVLIFLLFSYIGKISHSIPVTVLGLLETAAPFLLAWLLLAWPMKGYQPEAYQSVAAAAKKTLLVWLIAGFAGLALRAAYVGHIPDWTFVAITMLTVAILLLLWRLAFAWAVNRAR